MLQNAVRLTRELTLGLRPTRSSVQTASPQTHGARQTPTRWNNPTRSYCCGSSAPALFQNSA